MEEKHPRTLILGWPFWPAQSWLQNNPDVTAARIYQERLTRSAKRWMNASFHLPPPLQWMEKLHPQHWYGAWKKGLCSYDFVILIDEVRGRDIFEFILQQNPHCKIVVFYDHAIEPGSMRNPNKYRDLPLVFCTCDRKVAEEYHIAFEPYFYIFSPYNFSTYETMQFSEGKGVFFIGEEKGDRIGRLARIRNCLERNGIACDFHLVRKRHGKRYTKQQLAETCDYLPYNEILQHIENCQAILEIISDGQTGLTQRPYEAMFFHKKLLTTSEEVCRYDFYCPQNVFVLGETMDSEVQAQKLLEFLQEPVKPFDGWWEYSLTAWVRRLYQRCVSGA
ncbi:MAG: hypothetical protein MR698_06565 [Selenomonas sp.]|nr:hypothetical protein [Selenomonas sp.]